MPLPSHFSGGIQVPFSSSATGGVRILEGDEYLLQLVRTLCGDGDSDNPFNDGAGVGAGAIFQNVSDFAWKAKVRQEIEDVFKVLQKANLAKLRGIEIGPTADASEYAVIVAFLSIETNTTLEVDTSVRRA